MTDTDEPLRIDERYPYAFGYLAGYAEDAVRALEGNPVGDALRDALARARAVTRAAVAPIICLGFHDGKRVYATQQNDGAMYRCACGEERWLNVNPGSVPPATLRWEAT